MSSSFWRHCLINYGKQLPSAEVDCKIREHGPVLWNTCYNMHKHTITPKSNFFNGPWVLVKIVESVDSTDSAVNAAEMASRHCKTMSTAFSTQRHERVVYATRFRVRLYFSDSCIFISTASRLWPITKVWSSSSRPMPTAFRISGNCKITCFNYKVETMCLTPNT